MFRANIFIVAVVFTLLGVREPVAFSFATPTSSQDRLDQKLNDIASRATKEGILEGVSFSVIKFNGDRLNIEAKRVQSKEKRMGWFYSPLKKVIELEGARILIFREKKRVLEITAGKAEIRLLGGILSVENGAEIEISGVRRKVSELTWKLSDHRIFLYGDLLDEVIDLSLVLKESQLFA